MSGRVKTQEPRAPGTRPGLKILIPLCHAVNLFLFGLAGPFLGRLMDMYGVKAITILMIVLVTLGAGGSVLMQQPWQLYLLWGVVIGAGSGGTSMIMGSTVVNRWFYKRRGLALGILGAAFSSGQLIFTPIIMKLNILEGWRFSTLSIVALLALVVLPLVILQYGIMIKWKMVI